MQTEVVGYKIEGVHFYTPSIEKFPYFYPMNLADKLKYKKSFKSALDKFANKLEKYVSTENGDWSVKGFIDVYKNIYTISSDNSAINETIP
ncbi:MAG: type II restriction endonuclease [Saprospiraceae bacterium]|nr:type II restriction endonuclease [Saprospiraceae bacterium]